MSTIPKYSETRIVISVECLHDGRVFRINRALFPADGEHAPQIIKSLVEELNTSIGEYEKGKR